MSNPYAVHVRTMLSSIGWRRAVEILEAVVRDVETTALDNEDPARDPSLLAEARAARKIRAKFLTALQSASEITPDTGEMNV